MLQDYNTNISISLESPSETDKDLINKQLVYSSKRLIENLLLNNGYRNYRVGKIDRYLNELDHTLSQVFI